MPGEALPSVDLTVLEGEPVNPEVLFERDADDTLTIVATAPASTLYVRTAGTQTATLSSPVAVLIHMIAISIPLLLAAVAGRLLQVDPYVGGAAALAVGIGAAFLACHLARGAHPVIEDGPRP